MHFYITIMLKLTHKLPSEVESNKQTASAGSNSKENSPTLRQRGTYEGQRSGSLSKPICQLSISQIVLYLLSPFHTITI